MLFGYAKPVPYNPATSDIRKGELIVGLVGPATNLALSLVGAAIAWGGIYLYQTPALPAALGYYIWYFFGTYFCTINLCLAFFNLILIPPLDGSSIIAAFLSDGALRTYYKVQQYAMFFFLLVILVLPYFLHVNIFESISMRRRVASPVSCCPSSLLAGKGEFRLVARKSNDTLILVLVTVGLFALSCAMRFFPRRFPEGNRRLPLMRSAISTLPRASSTTGSSVERGGLSSFQKILYPLSFSQRFWSMIRRRA